MKATMVNLNISASFKGQELERQDPWISPEVSDMGTFDLPCYRSKIKIEESELPRLQGGASRKISAASESSPHHDDTQCSSE